MLFYLKCVHIIIAILIFDFIQNNTWSIFLKIMPTNEQFNESIKNTIKDVLNLLCKIFSQNI